MEESETEKLTGVQFLNLHVGVQLKSCMTSKSISYGGEGFGRGLRKELRRSERVGLHYLQASVLITRAITKILASGNKV